jgi:uncharacterized membrane protein YvbJ
MKCPNCGKNIKEEGTNYCSYCGQALDVKESLAGITKVKIEYDEAKSNSKGWAIAGCISLLAALAIVILIPFPLDIFITPPLIILGIAGLILSYHYDSKAKKLKDRL